MKKKLFLISSATIVVLAGVFGMKSVMALTNQDALFFENVNALTDAETTGKVCYDTVTMAEAQRVFILWKLCLGRWEAFYVFFKEKL